MSADASVNVVIFEVERHGKPDKLVGRAPTRADDCVRQVWAQLALENGLRPEDTKRIYSEWEPSDADKAWLDATFPDGVQVSYSFSRPLAEDGWDEAIREVEETISEALTKQAAEEEFAKPIDQLDDLLPVLRTAAPGDGFSEAIVNRPVAPGLGFFLGHVNLTPRQTIGTRYVMVHDLPAIGKSADELFAVACRNLATALQVEAVDVEGERVLVIRHPMDMGASAVGLPDLHANAVRWLDAEEVLVGFPDPSTLFVTAMSSAKAIERLREAVLTSDYAGAVALTPACYRLGREGLTLIAARVAPEGADGAGQ